MPDYSYRGQVSIKKASELLGVSRRTIYNWISNGRVQYVRTAGGAVRIFTDSLWKEGETVTVSKMKIRRG